MGVGQLLEQVDKMLGYPVMDYYSNQEAEEYYYS